METNSAAKRGRKSHDGHLSRAEIQYYRSGLVRRRGMFYGWIVLFAIVSVSGAFFYLKRLAVTDQFGNPIGEAAELAHRGMFIILYSAAVSLVIVWPTVLSRFLALRKGYNPIAGLLMGFFFSWFGYFTVLTWRERRWIHRRLLANKPLSDTIEEST